ncbi:hypothetical protein Hanom_Chr17g01585241 [Helianthus anomalus]
MYCYKQKYTGYKNHDNKQLHKMKMHRSRFNVHLDPPGSVYLNALRWETLGVSLGSLMVRSLGLMLRP